MTREYYIDSIIIEKDTRTAYKVGIPNRIIERINEVGGLARYDGTVPIVEIPGGSRLPEQRQMPIGDIWCLVIKPDD